MFSDDDRPKGIEEWFDRIFLSDNLGRLLAVAAVFTLLVIGIGIGIAR